MSRGTDTVGHTPLEIEIQRSTRYFDRFTRVEGNLADIRKALGVSNRPQKVTLQRIDDLLNMAASWVAYSDAHHERWMAEIARQEGRR